MKSLAISPFSPLLKIIAISVLVFTGLIVTMGSAVAAQLVGNTVPKINGKELIQELKQGGYIIFFRHGATVTVGEKKVTEKDMTNCSIQRNLSAAGIKQTKAIGKTIKQKAIPIGDVYASPYCRTMDTALNMFGKAQRSDDLFFGLHLSREGRKQVTKKLLQMLATPPKPGSNTALVSHTSNLVEAVNIYPKPEGVAHVFKPLGNNGFTYIGMILPDDWLKNY